MSTCQGVSVDGHSNPAKFPLSQGNINSGSQGLHNKKPEVWGGIVSILFMPFLAIQTGILSLRLTWHHEGGPGQPSTTANNKTVEYLVGRGGIVKKYMGHYLTSVVHMRKQLQMQEGPYSVWTLHWTLQYRLLRKNTLINQ